MILHRGGVYGLQQDKEPRDALRAEVPARLDAVPAKRDVA